MPRRRIAGGITYRREVLHHKRLNLQERQTRHNSEQVLRFVRFRDLYPGVSILPGTFMYCYVGERDIKQTHFYSP